MAFRGDPVRVLIIPGLHNSGPAHWQTWLEAHFKRSVRVEQSDWNTTDLAAWVLSIEDSLAAHPGSRWVAVAHSFGCLALARYLSQGGQGVHSALLVAPADPDKFDVAPLLPQGPLAVPSVVVGSESDPWMQVDQARAWARTWQSQFINLGDAGHINTEAGYGPLPPAKTLVELMIHRVERARQLERAHPLELSFAI
ncbi:MAG: hypothetical protein RLZZ618_1250 [Pseudomonadota bacterium]|jgi:predicted alpha/beta hydrolase family esterase